MDLSQKKLELITWITQLSDVEKIEHLLEEKRASKNEVYSTFEPIMNTSAAPSEPKSLEDIQSDDPESVEKARANFKWRNRSNAL